MKCILLAVGGVLGLLVAAVAAALALGLPDVAADSPHAPVVSRLIEWVREGAIARRAQALVPPANLADAERIRRGSGNYEAMCAECHGKPGEAASELSMALYPAPPDLTQATALADPGRLAARRFWIIKHGIKGSGMPAWSKGGMEDESIWDLAAFLDRLPGLSAQDYQALVATSPGHSHAGMHEPAATTGAAVSAEPVPHEHAHEHASQPAAHEPHQRAHEH